MSNELSTIIDFIRYGASPFTATGLCFGHSHDNALDEHDLSPAYGRTGLLDGEKTRVLALFEKRIAERVPVCYSPVRRGSRGCHSSPILVYWCRARRSPS